MLQLKEFTELLVAGEVITECTELLVVVLVEVVMAFMELVLLVAVEVIMEFTEMLVTVTVSKSNACAVPR